MNRKKIIAFLKTFCKKKKKTKKERKIIHRTFKTSITFIRTIFRYLLSYAIYKRILRKTMEKKIIVKKKKKFFFQIFFSKNFFTFVFVYKNYFSLKLKKIYTYIYPRIIIAQIFYKTKILRMYKSFHTCPK